MKMAFLQYTKLSYFNLTWDFLVSTDNLNVVGYRLKFDLEIWIVKKIFQSMSTEFNKTDCQ